MNTEEDFRHAKFAILKHTGQGAMRRDVASPEPWVYFKADEVIRLSDFAMMELGAQIITDPGNNARMIDQLNGRLHQRTEELKFAEVKLSGLNKSNKDLEKRIKTAHNEITELKAALDVAKMTRVLTPPFHEHKDRLVKAVRVFFDMPQEYYHQKQRAMEAAIEAYLEPLKPTQEELDIQRIEAVLSSFAIADEHTGDRDDHILAQRMYDQGIRVKEEK